MGLRDLTTEAMVGVTAAWVEQSRDKAKLLALRRVAPLMPDVEKAHAGLLTFQVTPAHNEKNRELMERATELDALHDRKARGLHGALSSLELLADRIEEADAYNRAQAELFPKGLTVIQRSYLEEAGQAELVEARLSPATVELLERTKVGAVTLRAEVEAWKSAALELGEVEAERVRLGEATAAPTTTIAAARNAWISAVNGVLHMVDLETDLPAADRSAIVQPLEQALDKATAARKRAAAAIRTGQSPRSGRSPVRTTEQSEVQAGAEAKADADAEVEAD